MNIKKYLLIPAVTAVLLAGCGEAEAVDVGVVFEPVEEPPVIEVTEPEPEPEPVAEELIEKGIYTDYGIHEECIKMMETIVESDIENGFTSAQISIIRDGVLVYENAFGKINSFAIGANNVCNFIFLTVKRIAYVLRF